MKKHNANLLSLVKMLNTQEFLDGSKLGEKLHITRSAVWKAIEKLRAHGIEVKSIKGKGYALVEELILYEPALILSKLTLAKELAAMLELKLFSTIGSTNEYLKTVALQNKITVCIAEEQTSGRGRFARQWYSPFGQNTYMSLGYSLTKEISSMMGVSLVVGLAVINALKEYGINEKFTIKWPNDILWDSQKIAGILIDANAEINGNSKLIIGIGLNLNMTKPTKDQTMQGWSSIKKITAQTVDRNKMAALLISNVVNFMQQFIASGLPSFLAKWQTYDYLLGKTITIGRGGVEKVGVCRGIDNLGQLRLQLADGSEQVFAYGDATVAKS